MTKVIYINWYDRQIIPNEKEKRFWLDEWIEEHYYTHSFKEWLEARYEATEIYNMTAEEKAELPTLYEKYLKDINKLSYAEAEGSFRDNFEAIEIEIEVGGYAE